MRGVWWCTLLCLVFGLRSHMDPRPMGWEEVMETVAADKGWVDPEEEAQLLTPHANADGGNRKLNIKMITPWPGPRKYLTEMIVDGNWTAPSVLFDVDHLIWEREQADPIRSKRKHCRTTKGDWCGLYDRQAPIAFKSYPKGTKVCQKDCNNVGNCNYDTGLCDCPAGWTGVDCTTRQLRPCTNSRDRPQGSFETMSHIDEMGRDKDWLQPGWTASRCAGICEAEIAMCWCDGSNKNLSYTHAPPGSPPGTPPIRKGRPLTEYCSKVTHTKDGKKTDWGNVPYEKLYGPNGWCEAERGERCESCMIDGLNGDYCDEVTEMYCPNQCAGQGECNQGFCKCKPGWYGTDCSKKSNGASKAVPDSLEAKPWVTHSGFGLPPPAGIEDGDPGYAPADHLHGLGKRPLARKRPFIYVYDIPPPYTTRMLQYRLSWKACTWRHFASANESKTTNWIYGIETYLHETLLASPHRTLDPEEADFFYVPVYITCFFWPVVGYADFPYWYSPAGGVRPMHAVHMMMEMLDWMKTNFPFWNRNQGKDHIWLQAHDEGACWMPTEIYKNSIILTHWGRLDINHTSNGYLADDYSTPQTFPPYQPKNWTDLIQGHECYNPKKDLVIPSYKPPTHFSDSPLLNGEPLHKDVLLFFRGDVGNRRLPNYSRGIRQKIFNLAEQNHWREKYQIVVEEQMYGTTNTYSSMLARSTFCLVAPGDGWSARAEDAVLHGCIPLVIMDNVHAVFESILDWDTFSVRITEAAIPDIPEILLSIPPAKIGRMQRRLVQVWHRLAYMRGTLQQSEAKAAMDKNVHGFPPERSKLPSSYPIQRKTEINTQDDAFSTIMQWLYSKIPAIRKHKMPMTASG